jgi:hypothetical protein
MAVAVSFTDVWTDGRRIHAIGTLVFSGNYAAGGDAIAIKAATATSTRNWKSKDHPIHVIIQGKGGYFYEYDLANRKVKVRQNKNPADAGGADIPFPELAAAAYPAGVINDVVTFYAMGKKV